VKGSGSARPASDAVTIRLIPHDVSFTAERGSSLKTSLSGYGVEFPCGGDRACGGCAIRVQSGLAAVTARDRDMLSPGELSEGWRLGCRLRAEADLVLDIGGADAPVLSDGARVAGGMRDGFGIAIDLGSTTVAAQLIDRKAGEILGVRTGLNPQTAHGADIMSRVRFATTSRDLTDDIRRFLGKMVQDLAAGRDVADIVLVGNTVMHHLFCGLDVAPLSRVPFASPNLGEQRLRPSDLGWALPETTSIRFLPCLGGFVGSDILAGIAAVDLCRDGALRALIDLGTNGEIALGNRERVLVASTAAGTAFEAGCIHDGMRAAAGAIAHVAVGDGGRLDCEVIGGGSPLGVCGSGLVDAVACGLKLGRILPSGRIADGSRVFPLTGTIALRQADVRELQLAKAAIAAGLRILLKHWGASMADVETLSLAGAFGNYLEVDSARRIGLLECAPGIVTIAGNTALRGAKQILAGKLPPPQASIRHVTLAADPGFEDLFVSCMRFPGADFPGADRERSEAGAKAPPGARAVDLAGQGP